VGVLSGLKVLDLSWGISGPMTTMLLADEGAQVTKIDRPQGDPFPELSGYQVWNRGKRRATLDLKTARDRERFRKLSARADIVVQSFRPGVAERLGVDYATLAADNPRLIYCAISAYGPDSPDADRPGIDALVAARTGHQWEMRGIPGGILAKLAGAPGMMPDLDVPDDCWVGPEREGPLFAGVPWVSLATFYIASVHINAALHARQRTGRGQRIDASLFGGVLATTLGGWQKVERPETPHFQTWVYDPRAPKGFFRTSDGRWTHHWVPLPDFVLPAAASGMQKTPEVKAPKQASFRVTTSPQDMVLLHAYQKPMADAVAQYSADAWTQLAAEVGTPVQKVRSPEEALLDPLLVADGCVVEVPDAQLGAVREVGRVIDMPEHPFEVPGPTRAPGADTAAVVTEADGLAQTPPVPDPDTGVSLGSPLEGVTVLDLGLAVAGPFGTQVLAQLGARVIKVTTTTDKFWFSNHIAMCCNRDKDSITLNLKDPAGLEVLHRLVRKADVVQHNMRYDAALRLHVDYESLRAVNPRLVYCHTMGHEQGPRASHPGNDQTGAALAGTTWLDGGLDNGGRPLWSATSLGDTGNGFLSAIGIVQALYDRERTGQGQFVRTSIVYAQLLNASTAWITPDGAHAGKRQKLDAQSFGWGALYRLYETADGWLCLAAFSDAAWNRLCGAIGRDDLAADPLFADADARGEHDAELAAELAATFRQKAAVDWCALLDAAGVPCEVSDPDFAVRLFSDPEAERRHTVVSFSHPKVGQMKMAGLYATMSDTPGKIWGPPLWPGQNTRQILAEFGYQDAEIDKLLDAGVAEDSNEEPAAAKL
jgi:crotonobetainyl-CoA:carnitine CoA-transferase CaiB-like acyl-CoA transferase